MSAAAITFAKIDELRPAQTAATAAYVMHPEHAEKLMRLLRRNCKLTLYGFRMRLRNLGSPKREQKAATGDDVRELRESALQQPEFYERQRKETTAR